MQWGRPGAGFPHTKKVANKELIEDVNPKEHDEGSTGEYLNICIQQNFSQAPPPSTLQRMYEQCSPPMFL